MVNHCIYSCVLAYAQATMVFMIYAKFSRITQIMQQCRTGRRPWALDGRHADGDIRSPASDQVPSSDYQ